MIGDMRMTEIFNEHKVKERQIYHKIKSGNFFKYMIMLNKGESKTANSILDTEKKNAESQQV